MIGFVFIKNILTPLVQVLINKFKGVNFDVEDKISAIENNHLHEVNRRLEILEQNDRRIEERSIKHGEEIAYIKAKINGK